MTKYYYTEEELRNVARDCLEEVPDYLKSHLDEYGLCSEFGFQDLEDVVVQYLRKLINDRDDKAFQDFLDKEWGMLKRRLENTQK